jgi:hypothetical protein
MHMRSVRDIFVECQLQIVHLVPEPTRKDTPYVIRLKRIYNFSCSMLVFTPFALCFVTLYGIFMHFLELTY